jgi:hypothetical protein
VFTDASANSKSIRILRPCCPFLRHGVPAIALPADWTMEIDIVHFSSLGIVAGKRLPI